LICGIGREKIRQNMLDAILMRINKVEERGNKRMIPNLMRPMTEKEEVRIIFDNTTRSAVFVYVCSKTMNSICRGNSISEKPPGKSFK
jgi:hypothetical protein